MIYLNMPIGSTYGWGVCGKYLAHELARRTDIQLVAPSFTLEHIGDELEFHALQQLLPPAEFTAKLASPAVLRLDAPLLQSMDIDFSPLQPNIKGTPGVGYTFFEQNLLLAHWMDNARRHYQHITTGSSWCTRILTDRGLTNVSTVLQGIDPSIFFPAPQHRDFLPDHFIIFSGGKFEIRKGQDFVIRAFKVLQDRHKDVLLIASWYNPWEHSFVTMKASPYISVSVGARTYLQNITQTLIDNGVDLSRTILLASRPNPTLAHIYRNTDVGIFPNRCEGGTNLVLMEYMACGKPVIATATTGHADIINPHNARIINSKLTSTYKNDDGVAICQWPEPDLEQTIEQLEWAYQHRDALKPLGQRAAADLANLTWGHTAETFLKVIHSVR